MLKQLGQFLPMELKMKIKNILFGRSIEETFIVYKVLSQKKGRDNIMVDVGAHHGDALLPFAQNNWSIYAFEPDPKNMQILKTETIRFSNVQIDNRAVSDSTGKELSLYTSNVSAGISSLSAFHESHQATTKVVTVRLEDYCKENKISKIDFLKIDTEGFDLFVLKGFDWSQQEKPSFIVTEFENNKTKPLGYTFQDQCDFLRGKGYHLLISEFYPVVAYGKRHKWKRFVLKPEKISDPNAWGNIIATMPKDFNLLKTMANKFGKIET